jgi:hypothetical protein
MMPHGGSWCLRSHPTTDVRQPMARMREQGVTPKAVSAARVASEGPAGGAAPSGGRNTTYPCRPC